LEKSELIEAEKLSFSEFAAFLAPPTPAQVEAWQQTTALDWVREALSLRPQVYDIGAGS
jgi:hypothetical protein